LRSAMATSWRSEAEAASRSFTRSRLPSAFTRLSRTLGPSPQFAWTETRCDATSHWLSMGHSVVNVAVAGTRSA
jgi:hypothetical protein